MREALAMRLDLKESRVAVSLVLIEFFKGFVEKVFKFKTGKIRKYGNNVKSLPVFDLLIKFRLKKVIKELEIIYLLRNL